MSKITKDSRTTLRKINHAETSMQALKEELDAMTLSDFPDDSSPPSDEPIMAGCYGNNSPKKARKRGSGGI